MNIADSTVLVLEDEIIVAFALEDMLIDMGARVSLANTIAEAYAHLQGDGHIALAVLDVNVNGAKSYPVAEELRRRGIQVVFATGYGDAEHPSDFRETPTLTKPYTSVQLAQVVARLS